MTPFGFGAQKAREEVVASILDVFYRERGVVLSLYHVPVEFQRRAGIDRVMTLRNGWRNTYEDKADFRASDTGNLFIETWSRRGEVRGWAYTCGAQYLDWFLPRHRTLLFGETLRLKERVRAWEKDPIRFPPREVVNENYVTVGLLVPIPVVIDEAKLEALEVPEEDLLNGIAKRCARRFTELTGQTIAEAVARAIGELWESSRLLAGTTKGRIAGIPYRGPAEVAAILEGASQKQLVAEQLLVCGEASEEWFVRVVRGRRLAPVIDQLRADGWAIEFDATARTYRLGVVGKPTVDPLPLFGRSA